MIDSPIIIGLSGKKGAGKNTLAEDIAKYVDRKIWQSQDSLHPFGSVLNPIPVFMCSFADHLKKFCIDVLGLDYSQCYGSDEEKNTLTIYRWDDTPWGLASDRHKTGLMSGREVMQAFGTECIRAWFGNVWAKATIRKIRTVNPKVAMITDVRFPNEIDEILTQQHSFVIRLTRSIAKINGEEDSHSSEKLLDNYDWGRKHCYILDNEHISVEEQREQIRPIVDEIFNKS
jgi:hypothetical protein